MDHSKHLCGAHCGLNGELLRETQAAKEVAGAIRSSDTLTFAEAMALDPSEVEASLTGDVWDPIDKFPVSSWTIAQGRRAKFRRSRPKISWARETSEKKWVGGTAWVEARNVDRWAREETVKEVVKFVRETWSVHGVIAPDIERHFLEPR